jgi:zinc/manganese transport system permease protein
MLAMTLSVVIALVTVWIGIAVSYQSNWPLGFFVGVMGAVFFLLGQAYAATRRRLGRRSSNWANSGPLDLTDPVSPA